MTENNVLPFAHLAKPKKPGKRSTPTWKLSPRQRKKLYKAERREQKAKGYQIIVDDLHGAKDAMHAYAHGKAMEAVNRHVAGVDARVVSINTQ